MAVFIARKDQVYKSRLLGFRGGVSNSVSDENIEDNELSDARNLMPDLQASGEIIKRDGIARHSTQFSESINGIFDGEHADYICAQTAIHTLDGTSVDGSLNTSTTWDHTGFDDTTLGLIDIFVSGSDNRRTGDASSFSAVANMPAFTQIESYNRFLFGVGHDRGHLRWSEPEKSESFPVTNEIIFAGESLFTGLKKFKNSIYIFFADSFHQITGTGEKRMNVTNSNAQVGCASPNSVVVTPYGLFWWSSQGLIWSSDGVNSVNVSLALIPRTVAELNKARHSEVHGVWQAHKGCVSMWVSNTGSSVENLRIDYFPTEINGLRQPTNRASGLGSMWLQSGTGVEVNASAELRISGDDQLYVGDNGTSGYVSRQTGAVDVTTDIDSYFETKRETGGLGEDITKTVKYIDLLFILSGATELTYGYYINDDEDIETSRTFTDTPEGFILDTSVLGTGVLGGTVGSSSTHRFGFYRRWKKIKHRISDSTSFQTRFKGVINTGKVISG